MSPWSLVKMTRVSCAAPLASSASSKRPQLTVHLLRQPGVGPAMPAPALLVIAFPRQALEGTAGLHPADGFRLFRRNGEIVRQWRAVPGEKLLPRHARRHGQGRVQFAQCVAGVSRQALNLCVVGKVADGHVANVVGVDEGSDQKEGTLVAAAQEVRADGGQFVPLVLTDGLKAQRFRRPARRQMHLAAPQRPVTGLAQLPAQGRPPGPHPVRRHPARRRCAELPYSLPRRPVNRLKREGRHIGLLHQAPVKRTPCPAIRSMAGVCSQRLPAPLIMDAPCWSLSTSRILGGLPLMRPASRCARAGMAMDADHGRRRGPVPAPSGLPSRGWLHCLGTCLPEIVLPQAGHDQAGVDRQQGSR